MRRPRFLGIDDAPFDKAQTAPAPLVAVMTEGPGQVEVGLTRPTHQGFTAPSWSFHWSSAIWEPLSPLALGHSRCRYAEPWAGALTEHPGGLPCG